MSTDSEFVITRTFDATCEDLYSAWTDTSALEQWWGPSGWSIEVHGADIRTGGTFHYCMVAENGGRMWGKFFYRELTPPTRIVWVNCFSDPEGNVTRAPFPGEWPLQMLNTLTIEEAEPGRTTLTLRSIPLDASPAEIQTFTDGHASMTMGWGGTLDELGAYLASAR